MIRKKITLTKHHSISSEGFYHNIGPGARRRRGGRLSVPFSEVVDPLGAPLDPLTAGATG